MCFASSFRLAPVSSYSDGLKASHLAGCGKTLKSVVRKATKEGEGLCPWTPAKAEPLQSNLLVDGIWGLSAPAGFASIIGPPWRPARNASPALAHSSSTVTLYRRHDDRLAVTAMFDDLRTGAKS